MKNEIKVFTPEDASKHFETNLPDFVIKAFNNLLGRNYSSRIVITQNDAIREIMMHADADLARQDIYDNHYLDIEDTYRRNGWDVEYDKPGWDENYEARFIFTPKK